MNKDKVDSPEIVKPGLPIPPGFTVSSEAYLSFLRAGGRLSDLIFASICEAVRQLETKAGARFTAS